jgi:integrase
MSTTQPLRSKRHVHELSAYYLKRGELRNHALIVMGIHTALRISDLLRLRWDDVYDFEHSRLCAAVTVVEKKTKKSKVIALHKTVIAALTLLSVRSVKRGGYLLENPRTGRAISRVHAYRLIRAAAEAVDLGRVSCHSLRKTFGYFAWKSGVSPAVIMDIYNHSSLSVTRRYLGITQDEKNAVYLGLRC